MGRFLVREVEKLKKMILSLSAVVEESVEKGVQSVIERSPALAEQVMALDSRIDQLEVDVEEECLKILALHQPVANDLRYVIAVLKINNDLERVGDIAGHIAERALSLSKLERIEIPFDLTGMAEKSQSMLRGALDALVNLDPNLARGILAGDDEVDEMNREAFARVEAAIQKRPDLVNPLLHVLSLSRYMERIADYATNIAEDILYLSTGEIVRHRKDFFMARDI